MDKDKYLANLKAVYAGLTPEEKRMFCNGVGTKLAVLRWIKPPLDICQLFEEESNLHDLAYWMGGRDCHRAAADAEFYQGCLVKCYSNDEPGENSPKIELDAVPTTKNAIGKIRERVIGVVRGCLVKCYSNTKSWYAKLRRRVWAMLCLLAVRLGGGASFNYCREPLSKERLLYLYEQLSSDADQ